MAEFGLADLSAFLVLGDDCEVRDILVEPAGEGVSKLFCSSFFVMCMVLASFFLIAGLFLSLQYCMALS